MQGATTIFQMFVKPMLAKHEESIELSITQVWLRWFIGRHSQAFRHLLLLLCVVSSFVGARRKRLRQIR